MSEKLREAARQALEALKESREYVAVYTNGQWQRVERNCQTAITALRAALAEPEAIQEPEAWLDQDRNAAYTAAEMDGESTDGLVPLYTRPPRREPLTNEEINALFSEALKGDKSAHWLCRAIERAVRGEKE